MSRPRLTTVCTARMASHSNTLVTTISLMANEHHKLAKLVFDDTGMVSAFVCIYPPKAACMPEKYYEFTVFFLPERVDAAALYIWYQLAERIFWIENPVYAANMVSYHTLKTNKYLPNETH